MSDGRYYKPTKEAIAEVRKNAFRSDDNSMMKYKGEVCAYCMLDHSNESIYSVINKLHGYLSMLNLSTRGITYKNIADECERDGDIEFCGYGYSNHYPDRNVDDAIESSLMSLLMLTLVVKTPDFFDEGEKFYEKHEEVMSVIDGFCETCAECVNFEVIDLFEKMCPYKEEDEETPETESGDDSFVTQTPQPNFVTQTKTE